MGSYITIHKNTTLLIRVFLCYTPTIVLSIYFSILCTIRLELGSPREKNVKLFEVVDTNYSLHVVSEIWGVRLQIQPNIKIKKLNQSDITHCPIDNRPT